MDAVHDDMIRHGFQQETKAYHTHLRDGFDAYKAHGGVLGRRQYGSDFHHKQLVPKVNEGSLFAFLWYSQFP